MINLSFTLINGVGKFDPYISLFCTCCMMLAFLFFISIYLVRLGVTSKLIPIILTLLFFMSIFLVRMSQIVTFSFRDTLDSLSLSLCHILMEKVILEKWEGKVSTRLSKATVSQMWPLFTDFFNFHKWFPTLANYHGIHGTNGEPGYIRYCFRFSIASNGVDDRHSTWPVSWSKERLIVVDHVHHSLNYEIVESNIGFYWRKNRSVTFHELLLHLTWPIFNKELLFYLFS